MADSNSVYKEFNSELLKVVEGVSEEIVDEFLADFDESEILKETTKIMKKDDVYQVSLGGNVFYAFKFGKECVFEFCDLVKDENAISRIKRQRVLSFLENNTALVSTTESHMIIDNDKGLENAQVYDILFAPDGTKISTTIRGFDKKEHQDSASNLINMDVSNIKTRTPQIISDLTNNIDKVQAM